MAQVFNRSITVDYSELARILADNTGNADAANEVTSEGEKRTLGLLKDLNTTTVGGLVLTEVLKTGKSLLIEHSRRTQEGQAVPKSWKDATPKGKKALDPSPGDKHDPTGGVYGTGLGSDVTIQYTPAQWREAASTCTKGLCGPGSARDEVLLHEVFHGLRVMMGKLLSVPMGDGYNTQEEFFAILVTNVYQAEMGRPLRGNHQDFNELQNAGKFSKTYRSKIDLFRAQHTDLAKALEKVTPKNGAINPILK
jgi:hypothetical protein